MTDAYLTSYDDAQRMSQTVNAAERQADAPLPTNLATYQPSEPLWFHAKLTTPMPPATPATPQTFQFTVYEPDVTSSRSPLPFILSADPAKQNLTGVNRANVSAVSGTTVVVHYNNEEWSPHWIDT